MGFKWNNGERTLRYDTTDGTVYRLCRRDCAEAESSFWRGYTIVDENGISTITVIDATGVYRRSVDAKIVAKEEAKGHNYKRLQYLPTAVVFQ